MAPGENGQYRCGGNGGAKRVGWNMEGVQTVAVHGCYFSVVEL